MPIKSTKSPKSIGVFLTEEEHRRLSEIASKYDLPRGDVVRRLLRPYLDGNLTKADLFKYETTNDRQLSTTSK